MTDLPTFKRFLAIDWSGAKGATSKGIQLALCEVGRGAPMLLEPERDRFWSRQAVVDFVKGLVDDGVPTLVGFDFAFSYGYEDQGGYFPGLQGGPSTAKELWEMVERLNVDEPHLYGGAAYREPSPVAAHYWTGGPRPSDFRERPRRTELAATSVAKPHSAFKTFSASNVGTGSLAGMRALHRLQETAAVWPFDPPAGLTLVEIYPRFLIRRAKINPNRIFEDPARIDQVLRFYDSDPYAGSPIDSEDKADAVLSAAGVRALSRQLQLWSAAGEPGEDQKEGWIFGVV